MAKFRFYVDFWPGMTIQHGIYASTMPMEKRTGVRRFAFDVMIPDGLLHEVDVVSPEVSSPMLVPDHQEHTDD